MGFHSYLVRGFKISCYSLHGFLRRLPYEIACFYAVVRFPDEISCFLGA
jgi:hypothetical protein